MSLKFSIAWVVAGLAMHFTFAFLMGVRHERDQAVRRENAALAQQVHETRAAARELQEMALTIQAEQVAGLERLNAIASDFEVSREQYQTHFIRQRGALAALLSKRPDLESPAGADVLRHWTASNAGADTEPPDPAPAANSGGVDAAVPDITDAGRGHLGEPACEPRCGDSPLPPVPGDAHIFDRSGTGAGAHGEAELLRAGAPRGDVP